MGSSRSRPEELDEGDVPRSCTSRTTPSVDGMWCVRIQMPSRAVRSVGSPGSCIKISHVSDLLLCKYKGQPQAAEAPHSESRLERKRCTQFYQISDKRVPDDSRGASSFHTNSSPEAAAAADQSGADSLF